VVLISETMRLSERGDPVLGLWEAHEQRIVVRRDQLGGLARYAGTLLHEISHMVSGTTAGRWTSNPSCPAFAAPITT
jgi:hypothetical protein